MEFVITAVIVDTVISSEARRAKSRHLLVLTAVFSVERCLDSLYSLDRRYDEDKKSRENSRLFLFYAKVSKNSQYKARERAMRERTNGT